MATGNIIIDLILFIKTLIINPEATRLQATRPQTSLPQATQPRRVKVQVKVLTESRVILIGRPW